MNRLNYDMLLLVPAAALSIIGHFHLLSFFFELPDVVLAYIAFFRNGVLYIIEFLNTQLSLTPPKMFFVFAGTALSLVLFTLGVRRKPLTGFSAYEYPEDHGHSKFRIVFETSVLLPITVQYVLSLNRLMEELPGEMLISGMLPAIGWSIVNWVMVMCSVGFFFWFLMRGRISATSCYVAISSTFAVALFFTISHEFLSKTPN